MDVGSVGGTDPRILEAPLGRGLTPTRLLRAFVPGFVGLLFGSRALASWAGRLPEGWGWLSGLLLGWDGVIERVGLTAPYDVLHGWARWATDATF